MILKSSKKLFKRLMLRFIHKQNSKTNLAFNAYMSTCELAKRTLTTGRFACWTAMCKAWWEKEIFKNNTIIIQICRYIPVFEAESKALASILFSSKIKHIDTADAWLHSAMICRAVFLLFVKSFTFDPANNFKLNNLQTKLTIK